MTRARNEEEYVKYLSEFTEMEMLEYWKRIEWITHYPRLSDLDDMLGPLSLKDKVGVVSNYLDNLKIRIIP